MKSFTATAFQRKPADIFNAVQADSSVRLESNSRPEMVLVLSSEFDSMKEKINQLAKMVKKLDGDAKDQLDMLKG